LHKRILTTVGIVTVIVLALASCASGRIEQSGNQESIQSTSQDGPSKGPADETGNASKRGVQGAPPSPVIEGISISIPAGVVLQHGDLVVAGTGFQPGEEVSISARINGSESPRLIARVVADDDGTLSNTASIPLPDWLNSGVHTLVANGEKSGTEAETPLFVRADKTWIEVGDYGVRPTDTLGFVAGGFEPGETVAVLLDSLPDSPLTQIKADEAGNIPWTEVKVPVIQGGDQTLVLRGNSSGEEATSVISVVPLAPWIELVPYAGLPGSQVKIHGHGFVPGETIHVAFGQNEQLSSTFVADEYGNFFDQALTTIPADTPSGQLQVKVIGEQSNLGVSQNFNVLALKPWVGLDVYAGPPGTTVRFRGVGFAANEKVTIHLASPNSPPVASAQTNENGEFGWAGTAMVPVDSVRDVTFYATGEGSHSQASVDFSVIIIPTPVLPAPAQPGALP